MNIKYNFYYCIYNTIYILIYTIYIHIYLYTYNIRGGSGYPKDESDCLIIGRSEFDSLHQANTPPSLTPRIEYT